MDCQVLSIENQGNCYLLGWCWKLQLEDFLKSSWLKESEWTFQSKNDWWFFSNAWQPHAVCNFPFAKVNSRKMNCNNWNYATCPAMSGERAASSTVSFQPRNSWGSYTKSSFDYIPKIWHISNWIPNGDVKIVKKIMQRTWLYTVHFLPIDGIEMKFIPTTTFMWTTTSTDCLWIRVVIGCRLLKSVRPMIRRLQKPARTKKGMELRANSPASVCCLIVRHEK